MMVKQCAICDAPFVATSRPQSALTCSRLCSEEHYKRKQRRRWKERYQRKRQQYPRVTIKQCVICDAPFEFERRGSGRPRLTCSLLCSKERQRQQYQASPAVQELRRQKQARAEAKERERQARAEAKEWERLATIKQCVICDAQYLGLSRAHNALTCSSLCSDEYRRQGRNKYRRPDSDEQKERQRERRASPEFRELQRQRYRQFRAPKARERYTQIQRQLAAYRAMCDELGIDPVN